MKVYVLCAYENGAPWYNVVGAYSSMELARLARVTRLAGHGEEDRTVVILQYDVDATPAEDDFGREVE